MREGTRIAQAVELERVAGQVGKAAGAFYGTTCEGLVFGIFKILNSVALGTHNMMMIISLEFIGCMSTAEFDLRDNIKIYERIHHPIERYGVDGR